MIEVLDKEHPRYRDRKVMWRRYWDFYAGGEQLRRNAALYLIRRQKEPNDIYSERLSRVFYENYLGSCIDWYAAALFRSRPALQFRTTAQAARDYYGELVQDADRRGTGLFDLVRKAFVETLVFGESFMRIDFPHVEATVETRAQEDAVGRSRAYLAPCSPLEVINWRQDPSGELEWAVLRTDHSYQERFDDPNAVTETRWTYFDKENYRIYSSRTAAGNAGRERTVELVDEGRHALAGERRVPLVRMAVSEGLWLANKAALLAEEHFNKSNALSWALHMGLFAMPVVYSEREWQQIVGEAYYIQLGPDDRFGWTEPEGKVFEIAASNLDRLKDEIYRVCYLMTQAGGREARNLGQSGASKKRDFAVTHEVLRAYGAMVREFMSRTLQTVASARGDDVQIEIAGMDSFDEPDLGEEMRIAAELKALDCGSPRLEQEIRKRVALKYLEGSTQATKNVVLAEIEAQ